MEFTAIGDGVNLGSRLEGASKQYGCDIVISESTYRPNADRVWARELDFIKVKGKTQPVSVYELVALRDGSLARPVPDQKLAVMEHYEKARTHYLHREFALAMGQFAQALEIDPRDKASSLHLERCQYWLQHSPPADWDGSWEMKEK
jgi:adenylate cyclase